jgi:quinol monooxygenase YgiN
MFAVTVTFTLDPDRREDFLPLVRANAAASLRDEPGCHRFDVAEDPADPARIFLYELYTDAAAFEAHKATPHFHAFDTATRDMIRDKAVDSWQLAAPALTAPLHLKPAERPHLDRGNGAMTVKMLAKDSGASFRNGFTELPPMGAIPLHTHNCEEAVLVVSGRAIVEVDGQERPMELGEVSYIPADVPHRFRNPGPETLTIFWTYASAKATRTLVATGDTRAIDAEG